MHGWHRVVRNFLYISYLISNRLPPFRVAFEIVALAAGKLGELPLAAQAVIMTTDQSKAKL